MDLSGRPLLDTRPDHELFAGRDEELARLVASVERRLNVLVVGERGYGKTTLLRQLAFVLREKHADDPPPAFVEGGLADDDPSTFLDLVRYRLGLPPKLREPSFVDTALGMYRSKLVGRDTLELPALVKSLREAAPDGHRVVLVDDVPASPIGRTIFGQLRDEIWQLPLTWVLTATETDAASYLSPPSDAFFDVVLNLEPLALEEQRKLLEARVGAAHARRIAGQIDEGNPRRLLGVAREALQEDSSEPSELWRARKERDERVHRLGRPAAMLMAELESLGAVSASDETLLRRLGWTRSRAVQVFRQLEEEGLVTSSTVKGGAGRPRKVYRPADVPTETEAEGDTAG